MHSPNPHAAHSADAFRKKFWVSLTLTLPTLVFGPMLPAAFGYHQVQFFGSQWIAPVFGIAVFFYGGWVFVKGAFDELRALKPGMMTLIALALGVAFAFSVAVALGYPGMALWEELATLVTIMLLGHWLEMRSVSKAQSALNDLVKLLPDTAVRVRDDDLEDVPTTALQKGDLLLIRPGAAVPADGVVQSGVSSVNESMLTGESRGVPKRVGDKVIAGTINSAGSVRVKVTGTGDNTALAGIVRLVHQAQSSRSRAQDLANRAAFFLTVVAVSAAVITFVTWLALGAPLGVAIERVVATLIIACPHALGLAIPLVIAISTTLGAKSGLLVRDRRGLEEARHIDTVVFDKTGTLTQGKHRVVAIHGSQSMHETEALRLAAAVEHDSEHSIAHAIVASAKERGIPSTSATDFEAHAGSDASARVENRALKVGGPNLVKHAVNLDAQLKEFSQLHSQRGETVVYLTEGVHVLAAFAIADALHPAAKDAVAQLKKRGIDVVLLTGDAKPVASSVAKALNIETVFAQVLPRDKASKVLELQQAGHRVAMVGDGINDAPALVQADLGIAMGAGTDVAVNSGDVVLVRSNPAHVERVIDLSQKSYRKMVQNLWWAAGYNVVAIPLAAGVLAPWGLVLHPALSALLMSVSTIVVALNAQLLRRVKL